MSRPVWLCAAVACAVILAAGEFATGGRISGWGDVAFIVVFAVGTITLTWAALRART